MRENRRPFDFRFVFVVSATVSLVVVYVVLWLEMIVDPVQYTGTDFIAFYAAGRISQAEGPAHAYDPALQQRYEEQVVGFAVDPVHISPYLHPPFILPLTQAIASDNFILSFILWNSAMLAFLCLGTLLLMRLLSQGLSREQKLVALAGILLFFPSYVSLINGQDSAILYFGACVWLFGLLSGKDWLAGLGLAGMTIRPHLALLLALPFIFKRRGVWWWFLLGISFLALLSLAYAHPGGIEGFLRILIISGRGVNYHTSEERMVNAIGLLHRLLPGSSLLYTRWIGWGMYLAAALALCAIWARTQRLEEKHISLAVILALFTAPHLHFHDLVLLMIPMACLLLVSIHKRLFPVQDAVLLPLGVSLVLLFSFFAELLKYNLCYLVMLCLLLALWFPDRIFHRKIIPEKEVI